VKKRIPLWVAFVVPLLAFFLGWEVYSEHQAKVLNEYRARATQLEQRQKAGYLTGAEEAELAELRRRIAAADADRAGH